MDYCRMMFRPLVSKVWARRMSSASRDLVKVSVNEDTGFATVTMSSPPVNSLNLELLTNLSTVLTDLENNKCKGMVLTSDFPTVFCAGLDFKEIYKPELDKFMQFWSVFQDFFLKLFLSSFSSVAAVNGQCPAGGCMLALGCDYRIMVGPKYVIGLNETRVGVVLPLWLMESMKNAIGTRKAELALITGKLFPAPEALEVGLIDEMVTSKDEALQRAEEYLDDQSNLPPMARSITKIRFRQPSVEWLLKNKQEDAKMFFDFVKQPEVQEGLSRYLASLKKK